MAFFSFSEEKNIFLHVYSILSNFMPTSFITLHNLNKFTCLKTTYEHFTKKIWVSMTGSIHFFQNTYRFLEWLLSDLYFFISLSFDEDFWWVFIFSVHFKEAWFCC